MSVSLAFDQTATCYSFGKKTVIQKIWNFRTHRTIIVANRCDKRDPFLRNAVISIIRDIMRPVNGSHNIFFLYIFMRFNIGLHDVI